MHEFTARVELDDDAARRIAAVVERFHGGDLQSFLWVSFMRGLMDSVADDEDLAGMQERQAAFEREEAKRHG